MTINNSASMDNRWSLEAFQCNDCSLSWSSKERHDFLCNLQSDTLAHLRRELHQLADGTTVPCRGRDNKYDGAWDYGFCTKMGPHLSFQYRSGDKECFSIDGVNFVDLVHLAVKRPLLSSPSGINMLSPSKRAAKPIVLLAHGWSPQVGPNYPVIRLLAARARERGCRVIVPDFRPTYSHGPHRSRAERVKQIYEELLVTLANNANDNNTELPPLILVGHSQGGAAVACACTPKVCAGESSKINIRGLLMLGTEDPTAHDAMNWRPPVPHIEMVHAVHDMTIGIGPIRNLSRKWGCQLTELSSQLAHKGAVGIHGEDIHHDFLARDLMEDVTTAFEACLDKCLL